MTHLLRSDFYKLRKAKYFRVCLIITILLAIGTVFLLDFTYRIAGDQMASQMASQQDALSESGVSISVEGIAGSYEDLGAAGQLLTFFAGNTTLILAVLVSLFVGSEFNHGTMKLIASRQYSRLTIYSSKLIAAMAAGIFLTLIYVLFSFLTASFVWGIGDAPSQGWARTIGAAVLELFLLCAFLSLFVMFSFLIRQSGGALALNICFLEFVSLFAILGEMLVKKLTGKEIVISNYLLDTNMNALLGDLHSDIVLRALIVGICFFAVSFLIGAASFQKRDIK